MTRAFQAVSELLHIIFGRLTPEIRSQQPRGGRIARLAEILASIEGPPIDALGALFSSTADPPCLLLHSGRGVAEGFRTEGAVQVFWLPATGGASQESGAMSRVLVAL